MMINLLKISSNWLFKQLTILGLVAFLLLHPFSASSEQLNNSTEDSAILVLKDMQDAVLRSDYQIYLVVEESAEESNTLRYCHLNADNTNYAQLLYLEGPAKEVILHNNNVSYFQPESVSFSFPGKRIIEAFPDVIYTNFDNLNEYYDFVLLGKARTANRNSKLIRIIPKDKDRYNYVIWIDDDTHLPLRIDLLDLGSNIIRQVKVLSIDSNFDKQTFRSNIENREYPILLPVDQENSKLGSWQVNWLPKGFKENAAYNINYFQSKIDTRLFSDGIFSFTINVSEILSPDLSTNALTQGVKTVYSTNVDNMNIIIIGNIPLETIERIARSIKR